MPALVCPNCHRTNPNTAVYCYFDGSLLQQGRAQAVPSHQLAQEFYFPSGRRSRTFDELLQACQEEWETARDLLQRGVFQQFFTSIGRLDLARACQEALGQADSDIALTNFLASLPATQRAQGPKLDLSPRRLALGKMLAGETRTITLKVMNQGQGLLQGTLTVSEGEKWLRVGGAPGGSQCTVKTAREQQIALIVDTRGLSAAQTYVGKLRVITNGGLVEAPIQIEVTPHPFAREPFRAGRTPREIAKKMRDHPKEAAPILESGELAQWFARNNWPFPVRGTPARGVAGVQQFFEAMGLSTPPPVRLSQSQVQLTCVVPDRPRAQVSVQTPVKKFVYAAISSEVPWLQVLTPDISGPQQAAFQFAVVPEQLPRGKSAEGTLQVLANGNQKLPLTVRVEIVRPAPALPQRLLSPILLLALLFLLVRLLLIPVADFYARPAAVAEAAQRAAAQPPSTNAPVNTQAGWLQLPWTGLLLQGDYQMPEHFLGSRPEQQIRDRQNFRDFVVSHFIRDFLLLTWWIGPLVLIVLLYRRSGLADALWGLVAGLFLGIILSATLACLVLMLDLLPLQILSGLFADREPSLLLLLIWSAAAVVSWALFGALLALVLTLLGPLGQPFLTAVHDVMTQGLRLCGLSELTRTALS